MKKIITIISALAVSGLVVSCDGLLDQQSPDQLTTQNFWRTQADAETGLAAVYSQLECAVEIWEFAEVKYPVEAYREDMCNIGADALNYPTWVELYNFTYTNGNSQFSKYWEIHYNGISYANQLLEKVPAIDMDAALKAQILAETHFLRGYYHMKLLLNWERIVVRDEYIDAMDKVDKALSERDAAWDFIVDEYEAAIPDLPLVHPSANAGRATRGAAYAYLGYVYLTRAYEEPSRKAEFLAKAETAFGNVTGYALVDDFGSLFDGTNENSEESIFELQFTETTASGAYYQTALHNWIATGEIGGWDEISPNQALIDEFQKEGQIATTGLYDTRLYQTLFFNDPYYNDPAEPRVYGETYDTRFGAGSQKGCFRKYLPPTWEEMGRSRTWINIPLMRYADVLLLLAETLNEQNRPGEAIPLINQVRARADMPAMTGTDYDAVKAQIEHERIVEFALENTRFYDLRRWGKAKDALDAVRRTGFDPARHHFFPVPLLEVASNKYID